MGHSERVQQRAYERRWLILTVLCFSLLVIVLDNSILNVAVPTIVRDLDASNSQVQWIIDSYTLVFAGLLLTMGSLGDRFGRRGALQAGFVLFGLGSIASALATDATQLIATRAFMGIGGALIMPATLSIITNVFPANERGRAIGFWAGTAGAGAALGPLTGGFLLEHFYWGSVFLVNVPIVIGGLIAGFFLIPTSRDPAAPKLDPFGAVLSIASLTAILYAIIEAPSDGWTSPTILACLVGGLALLGVFGWWETHTDHPMLDVRFFKNPRFSAASVSITLIFFAMFGSLFLLTQYMQFTLGYDPLTAGIRLLPFALTMGITAPLSSKLVERIGTKITVTTGLTLVTIGLLLMTGLQVDTSYGNLVWRLMIMAVGMGLTMAPATESVMGSLPLGKAGVGSAVNDTTRQVGGALGSRDHRQCDVVGVRIEGRRVVRQRVEPGAGREREPVRRREGSSQEPDRRGTPGRAAGTRPSARETARGNRQRGVRHRTALRRRRGRSRHRARCGHRVRLASRPRQARRRGGAGPGIRRGDGSREARQRVPGTGE